MTEETKRVCLGLASQLKDLSNGLQPAVLDSIKTREAYEEARNGLLHADNNVRQTIANLEFNLDLLKRKLL